MAQAKMLSYVAYRNTEFTGNNRRVACASTAVADNGARCCHDWTPVWRCCISHEDVPSFKLSRNHYYNAPHQPRIYYTNLVQLSGILDDTHFSSDALAANSTSRAQLSGALRVDSRLWCCQKKVSTKRNKRASIPTNAEYLFKNVVLFLRRDRLWPRLYNV